MPTNYSPPIPTEEDIRRFKEIDSDFVDYVQFEDPNIRARQRAKRRFITGMDYVPRYQYPKLTNLYDTVVAAEEKAAAYRIALQFETARKAAMTKGLTIQAYEYELYRRFHEVRFKRIMMVEAAHRFHLLTTASKRHHALQTFLDINTDLFGELNQGWYLGMLHTEKERLDNFKPKGFLAKKVANDLRPILEKMETANSYEPELMTEADMARLHDTILKRYAPILIMVPDTDDSVVYNAKQCATIMTEALKAGGLYDKGWRIEINPAKVNPATSASENLISLPSTTTRTAKELRRLIVHEQEVHARRGENGEELGIKPLATGTAKYADVEEGLGVLLECAVEGSFDNPSFDRARDRYITAGLALGAEGGGTRDAREVYEILWRMLAIKHAQHGRLTRKAIALAKDKAYTHIENAFRSTDFSGKGVIYRKLKVYYEGLRANAQFFTKHIDNINGALNQAMVGKYQHTSPKETELVLALVKARRAVRSKH